MVRGATFVTDEGEIIFEDMFAMVRHQSRNPKREQLQWALDAFRAAVASGDIDIKNTDPWTKIILAGSQSEPLTRAEVAAEFGL